MKPRRRQSHCLTSTVSMHSVHNTHVLLADALNDSSLPWVFTLKFNLKFNLHHPKLAQFPVECSAPMTGRHDGHTVSCMTWSHSERGSLSSRQSNNQCTTSCSCMRPPRFDTAQKPRLQHCVIALQITPASRSILLWRRFSTLKATAQNTQTAQSTRLRSS